MRGEGERRTVDVVPDAGAVRGGVVVAKDLERVLGDLADGNLGEEREEVSGLADGVLADQAGRVRAGGVEVAQADRAPDARLAVAQVL